MFCAFPEIRTPGEGRFPGPRPGFRFRMGEPDVPIPGFPSGDVVLSPGETISGVEVIVIEIDRFPEVPERKSDR